MKLLSIHKQVESCNFEPWQSSRNSTIVTRSILTNIDRVTIVESRGFHMLKTASFNLFVYILSLLTFSLFIYSSLYGNAVNDSESLSSTHASYDGNALILTGQVLLDHGLGKMSAQHASLERQEEKKDFPFSLIHLKNDVILNLKNDTQLRCYQADLDFMELKGILLEEADKKVIYSDFIRKKDGNKIPLRLYGTLIELGLAKQGHDGKKTEYSIETVLAKQGVLIEYSSDFKLEADNALYRKILPKDNKTSSKEFHGIISAYPKNKEGVCYLVHDQDKIEAKNIDLDLIRSLITMHHPVGIINSSFIPYVHGEGLQFNCNHLVWDYVKQEISLKNQIHLFEHSLGTLDADEELILSFRKKNNVTELKSILSKGKTVLQYKGETNHTLISHGSILIDQDHLSATLTSPIHNGVVERSQQIYYEEGEIGVYGDQASIEYSVSNNLLQPSSFSIKGNIRLFSYDSQKPRRCGLADRVNYAPLTRTLILSANPGSRVLFWDEEQSVNMSAQEIHITYDTETNKESLKGVGSVKFTFSDDENSLLKKFFPFYRHG